MNDGWDGPMTGLMRGLPLTLCPQHGGWWTSAYPCPACGLARTVKALEAEIAEMKQMAKTGIVA